MRRQPVLDVIASSLMILASVILIATAYEVLARRSPEVAIRPHVVGDRLDTVPALRPLAGQHVLVIWIHSACKFCTASMRFYRQLAISAHRNVRIVAMGRESEDTIRAYLKGHQVDVDDILSAPSEVRLYSTPTLLILEPGLRIGMIWTGQLTADGERDVVSALRLTPSVDPR